ncbi:AMP-binding protein [Streptomyces sp. CB02400]|uniref:AMP-binding protein n=1 Tax=Streptomyces sp. CB02400 TaxID=1703944 RepID=UPI0009A1293A|nr:AMP-binding protein [Streptomyces sp. CB02400]
METRCRFQGRGAAATCRAFRCVAAESEGAAAAAVGVRGNVQRNVVCLRTGSRTLLPDGVLPGRAPGAARSPCTSADPHADGGGTTDKTVAAEGTQDAETARGPATYEGPLPVDPVCLICASGTTAMPKAVVSTHQQTLFAVHAIAERLRYRADGVVVVYRPLPLSFDYGLCQVFLSALAGSHVWLGSAAESGPALLANLVRSGATVPPVSGPAGTPAVRHWTWVPAPRRPRRRSRSTKCCRPRPPWTGYGPKNWGQPPPWPRGEPGSTWPAELCRGTSS